jgi:hypothetical protein
MNNTPEEFVVCAPSEATSLPTNTQPETRMTLKSTMSGAALKQFLERLIGLLEQPHTA